MELVLLRPTSLELTLEYGAVLPRLPVNNHYPSLTRVCNLYEKSMVEMTWAKNSTDHVCLDARYLILLSVRPLVSLVTWW
jgi:hypothetical protein